MQKEMKGFPEALAAIAFAVGFLPAFVHSAEIETRQFDEPPLRAAAEVLPHALIRGEHRVVLDDVRIYDSIHLFTIRTDFGDFDADGELMLRIRLRELQAIEALRSTSELDVAADSVGSALTDSIETIGEFVVRPVSTIRGIPDGISRRFESLERDLNDGIEALTAASTESRDDPSPEATDDVAFEIYRWYFDIGAAERRWSKKCGVDPYTSNEVLKTEIARVSEIDALAGKGAHFVIPKIPYVGYIKDVLNLVWTTDPRELRELNRKGLKGAGISDRTIERFFGVRTLTPTHRSLIVGAVLDLEGVGNREVIFEQTLTLVSEPETLFFIESLLMAVWQHKERAPLATLVGGTGIPVALAEDGRLLAFTAADYIYWTERSAPIVVDFVTTYRGLSDRPEVWIAGKASQRFVSRVNELGWSVRTGVRSDVLPLVP